MVCKVHLPIPRPSLRIADIAQVLSLAARNNSFTSMFPIHCCVYKPPREIRDGQWAALRAFCLVYVPDCCVQGNLEEEESCYGFNLDLLHFWCEEQQVGD